MVLSDSQPCLNPWEELETSGRNACVGLRHVGNWPFFRRDKLNNFIRIFVWVLDRE